MSPFRLYLWREWREHRFALLALVFVLPLVTALLCWPLARGQVREPYFHAVVAGGFALAVLAVVGGELLGGERRGKVHGWLERLPAGLEAAFRAKLVFFVATTAAATAAGFATAAGVAHLRDAAPRTFETGLVWALVAALGAWAFAASAWTQRGGLAVMAAALVLCLVGYPVWSVVTLGYTPRVSEWLVLGVWLVPSAILGAALGYVRGTRRGRGPGWAALLGLVPALPLGVGTCLWSAERLAERERFEPTAQDFELYAGSVSRDGRYLLGVGEHRVPRWGELPSRVVRVDLASGAIERLGDFTGLPTLAYEQADGMPETEDVLIRQADREPLLFSLADGSLRNGPRKAHDVVWQPMGLGARLYTGSGYVFRGPGCEGSYKLPKDLGPRVMIRPGRWLADSDVWHWFDPETGAHEPVGWGAEAEPLVVLPDGGILVREEDELRLEHPERGLVKTVDLHGLDAGKLKHGWRGERVWGDAVKAPWRDEGPIALQSNSKEDSVLVIDPESGASRRIEPRESLQPLARLDADHLLVKRWRGSRLAHLDLRDGSLAPIGPDPVEDEAPER